ncbi:metallophosphoesterase [Sphingomonas sp.]|jgi:hypothetical protein|uniref:metallophosphoesterase n=1 Tax=Sphingomonas sp. TaxID=28214 RepID=UPI002E373392|nr:metallophosphoesterase [Sphingomonas sp.]HEX4695485.1 metallophosphoesterase [Sphingomonas sp.]
MPHIKSFHSAPHSVVQSIVAAQAAAGHDVFGAAAVDDPVAAITAALETVPRYRSPAPRAPLDTMALQSAGFFSHECTAMRVAYIDAVLSGDTAAREEILSEYKMSSCDVTGWAGAAAEYLYWDLSAMNYVAAPTPPDNSFVYALPEQDELTVGILGDWGTGQSVAAIVVAEMMKQMPDVIVHVGDLYYAGTMGEMEANYLGLIANARAATGCRAPIYNLPGNHDYYTKGAPFYAALGKVNADAAFPASPTAPAPVQQASFFALSNSWLQLQGMDTGYHDSDLFRVADDTTRLNDTEAAWHLYQLSQANAANRSVLLFSHHQAWSACEGIGTGPGTVGGTDVPGDVAAQAAGFNFAQARSAMPMASYNVNLQRQLASVAPGTVLAWFWGHEHVLEVYDQAAIAKSTVNGNPLADLFRWVPYGACVGHSAFPMLDIDKPYGPATPDVVYNPDIVVQTRAAHGANVYDHGFTMVKATRNVGGPASAVATYYAVAADGSGAAVAGFPKTSTIA